MSMPVAKKKETTTNGGCDRRWNEVWGDCPIFVTAWNKTLAALRGHERPRAEAVAIAVDVGDKEEGNSGDRRLRQKVRWGVGGCLVFVTVWNEMLEAPRGHK